MKKYLASALALGALLAGSHFAFPREAAALGPSHQHDPVKFCVAVSDANLPDGYLRSLIYAENHFSGFLQANNGLYRDAKTGAENDFSKGREQAISWLPLSNFICDAAENGFKVRFEAGWFGDAPKYVVVEGHGLTAKGRVAIDDERGLDGEPKLRVTSFGSTSFDNRDQGRFAYCFTNQTVGLEIGDLFLGHGTRPKSDGLAEFCSRLAGEL